MSQFVGSALGEPRRGACERQLREPSGSARCSFRKKRWFRLPAISKLIPSRRCAERGGFYNFRRLGIVPRSAMEKQSTTSCSRFTASHEVAEALDCLGL